MVDVKESSGPRPSGTGLQSIPTDRISTVRFTQHTRWRRALFGTLFALGGVALGFISSMPEWNGESWNRTYSTVLIGTAAGGGVTGYFLGRQKDKQNVTVEIQQPDASGGRP